MSTTTVLANGDGSKTAWTDESSGTSNLYSHVDELVASTNDSDYIQSTSPTNSIFLLLQDMPSDLSVVTGVSVQIRAQRNGSSRTVTTQIVKSDESTALTDALTQTPPNGSWSNFTNNHAVTGSTDKASWDGARMKITASNSSILVACFQVNITYTASGGGSAAGVIGGGVSLSGIVGYQSPVLYHGEDVRRFRARREYEEITARLKERFSV
ncbi:MAG: hypothetical protein U0872_15445 [Planctomycetaceae bacterium]